MAWRGPNYIRWFQTNYERYTPDAATINKLKADLQDYEVLLFMGTWCGDSKREVPRFYKILDAADFPEYQLTVVALSGKAELYKQSPQHEEAGLNIEYVPTFIVYKDGLEIGRIIEQPHNSLEKDLLTIINKHNN
jgi:thiol-disulfide isomerase/thioredoxin